MKKILAVALCVAFAFCSFSAVAPTRVQAAETSGTSTSELVGTGCLLSFVGILWVVQKFFFEPREMARRVDAECAAYDMAYETSVRTNLRQYVRGHRVYLEIGSFPTSAGPIRAMAMSTIRRLGGRVVSDQSIAALTVRMDWWDRNASTASSSFANSNGRYSSQCSSTWADREVGMSLEVWQDEECVLGPVISTAVASANVSRSHSSAYWSRYGASYDSGSEYSAEDAILLSAIETCMAKY